MQCDSQKYKTNQVGEWLNALFIHRLMYLFSLDVNGLNPVWNKKFDFDVDNPSCALLRFVVQDLDVFSDPIDLGQAIIPVSCLRSGYRSVPLRNSYSEELELASLLIHLDIHKVSHTLASYHSYNLTFLFFYRLMKMKSYTVTYDH